MKRIITLALAAGLVVAATAPVAQAVEFSANGYILSTSQYYDDMNFSEKGGNGWNVNSRIDLNIKAVASENLYAQIKLRVPSTGVWGGTGNNAFSAATWGTTLNVNLRNAFIDFTMPMAPVSARVGYQYLGLPGYMGGNDAVLANHAAAVVVSADLGMLSPTFVYSRLYDSKVGTDDSVVPNVNRNIEDAEESDLVAVIVPVDMDMFTVTPWAAFADDLYTPAKNKVGTPVYVPAVESENNAFWVGATSQINMVENLTFGVDFLYSSLNYAAANTDNKTGFLFDAYATYSMDFATIGAYGWYASGADKNGKDGLTSIEGEWGLFAGSNALFFDQGPATWTGATSASGPAGTMGFAASIGDIAVVDNMKMGGHVMYVASTSERDTASGATGLEHEDYSAVEIGANATYSIYEPLTAGVNVYYTIPMDDVAGKDNAFTGGVTIKYAF